MSYTTSPLNTIGPTELRVSSLGVGTNRWGDKRKADSTLRSTFDAALAAGINLFDTAEMYGFGGSERTLGLFLPTAGTSVVVTTKYLPLPWRLGRLSLMTALRASLARLGVPRVDLYLIHWPMPPVRIGAWMRALAEAMDAGLVRAVGVSNFSADQTRRAHAALREHGIPLACNQVEYSLLKRDIERNGVLDACREIGATVIAYRPVAGGLLSGRYTPQAPPRRRPGRPVSREALTRIQPILDLLAKIGEDHDGKTPSQVALNWLLCKGVLPIPGVASERHVLENAGAQGWRMREDEVASLDEATEEVHLRM